MEYIKKIRTLRALTTILLVMAVMVSIIRYICVYDLSYIPADIVGADNNEFRKMDFGEGSIEVIVRLADEWDIKAGEIAAALMLMNHYSVTAQDASLAAKGDVKLFIRRMYRFCSEEFDGMASYYDALIEDSENAFFPVPLSTDSHKKWISYVNSWGNERKYGGRRTHEGTDLMSIDNIRGRMPVIAATEGTVTNIGWLEKGGFRIGVMSDNGVYYYYAHLDSYAQGIEKGSRVNPGTLLGMMGDTGYSAVEGTKGKFPVHLHFGMYIYNNGEEIGINPYSFLRYYEKSVPRYDY